MAKGLHFELTQLAKHTVFSAVNMVGSRSIFSLKIFFYGVEEDDSLFLWFLNSLLWLNINVLIAEFEGHRTLEMFRVTHFMHYF